MSYKQNDSVRVLNLKALAIAAALMTVAGSATAEELYGGGATFPAQAYVGNDYNTTSPKARLSRSPGMVLSSTSPIAPLTSWVFASYIATAYPGIPANTTKVSYCQSGSGTGKALLTGTGSLTFSDECGNFSGTPLGFTTPTTLVGPDYIGTDSPITQADVNAFAVGPRSARGALIQFPTIVGAIALPNNASVAANLNLTTRQVCEIFSARITDWSGIPGSGATGSIHIIYRNDNSGTTFAFTSFLATNCNGQFTIPAGYFKPNQSFRAAVPAVPGQPGSLLPAYALSTAREGNTQVAGFTKATSNAIGYADVAEVVAQSTDYVFVNNQDPYALPATITYSSSSLLSGQVLDPTTNAPVAVTGSTQPQCLRLIDPNAVPGTPSYPILAATYFAGYYTGNGTKADELENLYKFFFTTTPPTLPAGYAAIGNTAFKTAIRSAIDSCIN